LSNGILDEIQDYLDYTHRYDDYIAAVCIFHDDTRPSLIIHEDTYKCLSCNAYGSTKKLLEKLKSKTRPTVKKHIDFRNPFTKWTRKESLSDVLKSAWKTLNTNPSQGSYLKNRGIPDDARRKLKIGWREGWYTIPILDKDKKIIGAVARIGDTGAEAKYVCPAGQDPNLFYVPDWDLMETAKEIYVVFGIIDTITLSLYGVPSFSTTNGKRIDPSALDSFRKRLLFIPDDGEEDAALRIISKLGWRGKLIKMIWPIGTKDLNEIHVKYPDLMVKQFGANKYGI
jgi:DNA primase